MTEEFRYALQNELGNAGSPDNQEALNWSLQQPAAGREVQLPILKVGKDAVEYDRTPVPADWNLVNIYQNAKDGVVKIVGQREGVDGQGRKVIESMTGSGFFVTEDGRLATDYHVVMGVKSLVVQTSDGKRYSATVEEIDREHDLAIVKVNSDGNRRFKALPLGDPNLNVGDGVVAIGYPRGWQDMYISPGTYNKIQPLYKVVDATKLGPGERADRDVIDATIHVEPGNSGGPLISKDGRVIGIIATTDASPSAKRPGTASESTPISDFLNLLNRTRERFPVQPATTLPLDARPYYPPSPGPYPTRPLATSWVVNPFKRSSLGAVVPNLDSGLPRVPVGAAPGGLPATPSESLPLAAPEKKSYLGGFRQRQGSNLSDNSNNATEKPQAVAEVKAPSPELAPIVTIPDLKREDPPRLTHTLAHGFNVYNQFSIMRAATPSPLGALASTSLGVFDLASEDFGKFRQALTDGTRGEVYATGIRVGADALLIAGGLAGLSSKYRMLGAVASVGGSVIKLGADGAKYYRAFR
jgi:S1-C subfamily serine protease